MRLHHIALAILVVAIWGFNFVVIKVSLKEIPPILLCAVRFFLAAFPAIFFIKRPSTPLRLVVGFGLIMFALQFTLLFYGMSVGTSAGLASLVLQIHVFFTILLAVVFQGEKPSLWQVVGALVSFAGIGLVATHLGGDMSIDGLLLIIAAAVAWGVGNLFSQKLGQVDMLALVVWGSFVAWPPLLALSFMLEHNRWSVEGIFPISWPTIGAIAYIVYPSTLFGFAAWSWLLGRYPATTVAPFSLLMPIFGFTASIWVFDEPLSPWKIDAATLVIMGLCLNLFSARRRDA